MLKLHFYALAAAILSLAAAPSATHAQVAAGTPPLSTSQSGQAGSVDLGNLNIHIPIPVVNKAGRGTVFSYTLSYDSSIWFPVSSSGAESWQPVTNWGWRGETEAAIGYITFDSYDTSCNVLVDGINHVYTYIEEDGFVYHDPSGTAHGFNISYNNAPSACGIGRGTFSGIANDGSGYTMNTSGVVTTRDGRVLNPPSQKAIGSGSIVDRNGNETTTSDGTTFVDTLGDTVLSIAGSNPVSFDFQGPEGQTEVELNYTNYTVKTAFGCSGIAEYSKTGVPLVSSVYVPGEGTYTLAYEATPGDSSAVTGRISSITLPTGGIIRYGYTGANDGVNCADGSTMGLTRQTPDGTWTYTRQPNGSYWNTTVTDPAQNQTVYGFAEASGDENFYATSADTYQGSSASGTLLRSVGICYNGATGQGCEYPSISGTVTERAIYTTLNDSTSEVDEKFNSYGLPTETDNYDFAQGASPGPIIRKTLISYATLSGIADRPAQVTIEDGNGNIQSQTTYSYDQGTVVATSGTPQHTSPPSSSRGNTTTISYLTSSGKTLSKTFTYFDTGLVDIATAANGGQTSYTYGDCGNSFPTAIKNAVGLTTTMAWDCTGGVQTSSTDPNGTTTATIYGNGQVVWRPVEVKVTDKNSNVLQDTTITYTGATQVERAMNFGSSTDDVLTTLDSLGRPTLVQRREAPGSSNWDSVQTLYGPDGRADQVSAPYVAAAGGGAPSGTKFTVTNFDALGRPTLVTDAGGGTVNYSYPGNDVLITAGPAPDTSRQLQYDGLDRLESVCEITSASGSGSCGQTAAATGYLTTYLRNPAGEITTVDEDAQANGTLQTRSFSYDGLGRLTSETTPEAGTTNFYFDALPSGSPCPSAMAGELVERTDADGTASCYAHDALGRVTQISYFNGDAANTPTKTFVYGSATVDGVAMPNALGRLAEAYTSNSTGKIVDEGFGYDALGRPTDLYESTPHSGGWYHSSASYLANGALSTLAVPGVPAITFAADGEGRVSQVAAASGTNPVTGTTYNVFGEPLQVSLGNADSDAYQYDPATGRMTQYQFAANGATDTGALTWNANGTLAKLAITDNIPSTSDSQTCTYSYDALNRLAGANCGSFAQTFSYDAFGNVKQSGSDNWLQNYGSNNRLTGASYDADGNLTSDGYHTYTWDADGRAVSVDGVGITYDALGRQVEASFGWGPMEWVYTPAGRKAAVMKGQSVDHAYIALPGGTFAVYNSSGLNQFRNADWLGSSRLGTNPTSPGAAIQASAYAPFGQAYDQWNGGLTFTGKDQDTVWSGEGLYDFPARRYAPTQGRWVSPDPSGLSAVNPADPQTWNEYAYVRNSPLRLTDPEGEHLFKPGDTDWFGDCTINGVEGFCGGLGFGDLAPCPDNACQSENWGGQPVYYFATEEGAGYFTYSGPGALYYSPEAAGIAAALAVQAASIATKREYGGIIYAEAGVFSYGAAQAGPPCTDDGCQIWIDESPTVDGTQVVGDYHTHPLVLGGGGYVFSSQDLTDVDAYHFIATPTPGQVVMFNPLAYAAIPTGGTAPPICVAAGPVTNTEAKPCS